MATKAWIAAPFKFAVIPVSVLAVFIYAVVFGAVFLTDQTPNIPKNQDGLDLHQAYRDLHIVSTAI